MKISRVLANNRKKEFVIQTRKGCYSFPYSLLDVKPVNKDPLVFVEVDKEAAGAAFTYQLKSGKCDTVLLDQVLDFNRDPEYLREQMLYQLTVEAKKLIKKKRISIRSIVRRLNTSPSQVYRLLDTANYGKTIDQMLKLLTVLGQTVTLSFSNKAA